MLNKINEDLIQLSQDTRGLYRLSITEEEAQNGWLNILEYEMMHPSLSTQEEALLNSMKIEFQFRMTAIGMNYYNFNKLMTRVDKVLKEVSDASE